MKSQRIVFFTLVSIVVVALLAACTGGTGKPPSGGSSGGSTSAGKSYNVSASEFAFTPSAFDGKVDQKLTFKVTNKGTVEHTFVIQSTDGSSELASVSIQPGETKNLEFTPKAAGDYPIICNIAGHKESGMQGQLTVK